MEKVELLKIIIMYLKELGYDLNYNTVATVKENVVGLKIINDVLDENENNNLIVNEIIASVNSDKIDITDTCNIYINKNYGNIIWGKRHFKPIKPDYQNITNISYTKKDNIVIQKLNEINNNIVVDEYTNIIEVDNNYDLLKKYPKETNNKTL